MPPRPPPGWGPPPPGWGPPGGPGGPPPGPPPPGWGPPGGPGGPPPGPPPPGWGPPGGPGGPPPGPPPPGWGPPPGPPPPGWPGPPPGPPPPGWPPGPPGPPPGPPGPPPKPPTPPPPKPPTPPPPKPPTPKPEPPKPDDDKPKPSDDKKDPSNFVLIIPPGWKGTITSVGNQSYNQTLFTEYYRDARRVRSLLTNKSTPGNMVDTINGNTSIQIEELDVKTDLTLKWYLENVKDGKFANRLEVNKVSESATEIVYEIKVYDKPGSTTPDQVTTVRFTKTANNDPLGLANIQGDVLPGLAKALEYFYYFQITDVSKFKQTFASFALPKIITSEKLVNDPPPPPQTNPNDPFLGFNVAFSSLGVQLFGLDPDAIGDQAFSRGQFADCQNLGDPGVSRGGTFNPDWDAEYKANIHGIFLITAYNETNAQNFIQQLEEAFTYAPKRSSIKKVVALHGFPRPGAEGPNDPFGYRGGGITNPQVKGITFTDEKPMRYTGTPVIPMGVIVMGREGDEQKDARPSWAVDGSLIATRKLNCLVPEFDAYCRKKGAQLFSSLTPDKAAAKVGARLMGRWKNGTPVALSPDDDAPDIAKDDKRVNNFEFDQSDTMQQKCPFAAHMRKSNPRNDVPPEDRLRHLLRRHNMPYGPEVTDDERANGTIEERGLHLCTYQSSIERGFRFVQTAWYNKPDFPPGKPIEPGWDPVFGQTGKPDVHRFTSGVDPANPRKVESFLEAFVSPRGGEYFFSPSMKTLKEYIAA